MTQGTWSNLRGGAYPSLGNFSCCKIPLQMLKHLIFCYILGGETPEKINGEFLDVKKSRKKSLWIITEKTFHHNWKHHHVLQQTAHRKKKKTVPKKRWRGTPAKGPLMLPLPFFVYPSTAWREKKVSLREAWKMWGASKKMFFFRSFNKHLRWRIVKHLEYHHYDVTIQFHIIVIISMFTIKL